MRSGSQGYFDTPDLKLYLTDKIFLSKKHMIFSSIFHIIVKRYGNYSCHSRLCILEISFMMLLVNLTSDNNVSMTSVTS